MSDHAEGSFWTRDTVHYPRPVLPLFVSFGLEPVEIGSAAAYKDWSIPLVKLRYLVRNGYVYQRSEPVGGDAPAIMARFPALFNMWRIHPELRKRVLGFDRFVRDGGMEKAVFQWREQWKPEALKRLKPLRAFELSTADESAIADHLDACYDYLCWSWSPHMKIVMACVYARARWVRLCEQLFGFSQFEAYELVQRSDPDLFAASNYLSTMARQALQDPDVLSALEAANSDALQALQGTWFVEAVNNFIENHGDRPIDTYELDPTWREMPELVVGMVKSLLESDYDPEAEDAIFQEERRKRIDELRLQLTPEQRAEFDHWLKITEEAYPLIDTHDYILANIPASLVRYAALEVGRRLVAAGKLKNAEDIFYLFREELTAVLRDGEPISEIIAARKVEHQYNLTVEVPNTLGTPAPQPPNHVFPPAVAEALDLMTSQMKEIEANQSQHPSGLSADGVLHGLPGAPGTAQGPVRIVLTADDFERVQPGDILSCPFTTPSWTVLFPKVAGLVTDSGGALSHAAIVAREYGLPAVVGTGSGTRDLKDGQIVRIDGSAGTVQVIREGGAEDAQD